MERFLVFFCSLTLISISAFALAACGGVQGTAKPPQAAEAKPQPQASEAELQPPASEAELQPQASEAEPQPQASEAEPQPQVSEAEPQPQVSEAKPQPQAAEAGPQCLDCHGPYDAIIKATSDFTMPSGEVATPHQYVPHNEKVTENIPKCTECHTKHEIPLLDKSTVVKPDNVDYCYQNCHHVNNFQPCSACH